MGAMIRFFSGFCVATVIAQAIIFALLLFNGRLDSERFRQMIALSWGIDLSADRIQQALATTQSQEMPSFDEIMEKRALTSLELDLRQSSLNSYIEFLKFKEQHLSAAEERFDRRREAHRLEWEQRQAGLQTTAMKELQQTMEAMPPRQTKEQLVRMMEEREIGNVVAIIQAMPLDKRKKILAEFVDPADADKLQEILRRIGEGDPDKTLIEKALKDNLDAGKNAPKAEPPAP
jgi:uncharacterized protein YneF (UPF0154 family)